MWLFCEKGFVSIVVDRDDPDRLLVRARVKGDIERAGRHPFRLHKGKR
jgi:hypothetical protein